MLGMSGSLTEEIRGQVSHFSQALHGAMRFASAIKSSASWRTASLCRYITRPALSDERVKLNDAGQVELGLKTPWRDGTTRLVMSPLEFMQRLAALVPRPRLHLIRLVSA